MQHVARGGFGHEVGDGLAEALVIPLELLAQLHLAGLQSAELFAPPMAGELRHAYRPRGFGHRVALGHQHVDLPKTSGDSLRLVRFLGHSFISKWRKGDAPGKTTFQRIDHKHAVA